MPQVKEMTCDPNIYCIGSNNSAASEYELMNMT